VAPRMPGVCRRREIWIGADVSVQLVSRHTDCAPFRIESREDTGGNTVRTSQFTPLLDLAISRQEPYGRLASNRDAEY
jgi:hypothetical protein